jgi:glycosyltransferase involved in cell wall biosynthesis
MPEQLQVGETRYSVVIPVYNERESLKPLYRGIEEVFENLGQTFECVFVDDGSSDGSLQVLHTMAAMDPRICVVVLRRNCGKSTALAAGFRAAQGDFVITMDGDLQHSPSDLPAFIEKLEQGYDIVCGQRQNREETGLQRVLNGRANWVTAKLTGVNIHDFGGGFKAYRRELVSELPIYGELQRLIPVLASGRQMRICEVPITIAPRDSGVSKYGMRKKLPFLFDLITVRFLSGYITRPLHAFGTAGILAIGVGSLLAGWLILSKLLYGISVMQEHGPLMIASAVLIIAGIQSFALGLVAELQVWHYHRIQGRPAPNEVARIIRSEEHATSICGR